MQNKTCRDKAHGLLVLVTPPLRGVSTLPHMACLELEICSTLKIVVNITVFDEDKQRVLGAAPYIASPLEVVSDHKTHAGKERLTLSPNPNQD